jgi:hypothetical protein
VSIHNHIQQIYSSSFVHFPGHATLSHAAATTPARADGRVAPGGTAAATGPRRAACRRHAERRGWWGLSRWYIYHFEVIWLRVGILLKNPKYREMKNTARPR